MHSRRLRPLNIALVAILVIAAFDRFTSEYYNIIYPTAIDFFINNGRIIFGALLAFCLLQIHLKSKRIFWIQPNYYWAPILLHSFLSIKLLVNGNTEWHISLLGAASLLISFHVCATFSRSVHHGDTTAKIGLATTIIFLLIALYQYLTAGPGNMSAGSRFFFFTLHPNSAGTVWAFCAVTMLYLYRLDLSLFKYLKLGFCFVSLYLLYTTGSRGAFIACGAGFLATLLLYKKDNANRFVTPILVAVALIIIAAILGQQVSEIYTEHANRGNTRSGVYADSIKAFIDHPVAGLPYLRDRPTFVENLLLSYMMSAGFIGLILCAIYYFGSAIHLIRAIKSSSKSKDKTATYCIILSSMLLTSSIFEAHQIQFVTFGSFLSILTSAFLIQYNRKH